MLLIWSSLFLIINEAPVTLSRYDKIQLVVNWDGFFLIETTKPNCTQNATCENHSLVCKCSNFHEYPINWSYIIAWNVSADSFF